MALVKNAALLGALLLGMQANAAVVSANGSNHSLNSAQSLNGLFTQEFSAEVTDSTLIPHATVNGVGHDAWDYYSFTLKAPASVLFDVDHAMPGFDSWLSLYTADGASLGSHDDGHARDAGSVHGYDGYWNYAFANAGTYIIGVGKFSNSVIPEGMSYTLNISTVAAVPEPETYALLGIGLLGLFAAQRRKRMA